ncbi:MAG: 50S ribosomal protein L18 [Candidatus Woesearchaeota archaeon]
MRKKLYTVPYRRKREGKTDYRKRLIILKSKLPRLVIRKSNKHMLAQIIVFNETGDKVLYSANTKELNKYGWDKSTSNIPSAYLVGLLIAKKALKDNDELEVVVDLGLQAPIKGSKLFAVVKGASDGGLKINYSEEVVPKEERLFGEHISLKDLVLKVKDKILNQ